MKKYIVLAHLLVLICCNGSSQAPGNLTAKETAGKRVGGPCEGCEGIYESSIPFSQLSWTDTLPGYGWLGTPIEIRGVVYSAGGKPAPGVVLYIYHTDPQGIYPKNGNEKDWGKRHGYLRGWVKTNASGHYRFLTTRPGSYPQSNNPAHIHIFVKEERLNEYYIDDFHFDDDPLFTTLEREKQKHWGGSGLIKPVLVNGKWLAHRDIVLGLNVPNYPKE